MPATATSIVSTAAPPVDPYGAALARAAAAEARGDLAAAEAALEPLVDVYAQDYDIALRAAWIELRRGDYDRAEGNYRKAIARAPSSLDARWGLASALSAQGRCDDAERAVAALPTEAQPRARESIAQCAPALAPSHVTLTAGFGETLFAKPALATSPVKGSATGFLAGAGAEPSARVAIDATYRYLRVGTLPSSSSFDQHEGYVSAGYGPRAARWFVRGAVVRDGSGVTGTSVHGALDGRIALGDLGHLRVEATGSRYPDFTIVRLAPAWYVPVAPHLTLVPSAAVERGSAWLASASTTVLFDDDFGELWAGGKLGAEERPAYLSQSVVYDVPNRVLWGAWAGARVFVSAGLSIQVAYAFDRYERVGASPIASHSFLFQPAITF